MDSDENEAHTLSNWPWHSNRPNVALTEQWQSNALCIKIKIFTRLQQFDHCHYVQNTTIWCQRVCKFLIGMSCKSRVVELTCKWWYVNMLPGSTVTLHRTGTSATTGKRPQSSGQLVFSFLKDVLGRGYAQTICLKGGYRKFFYSFSLGARLLVWASWLTSNKWTNKGILGVGSWSDGRVKEQLSRRTSSTGPVLGSGS